MTKKKINFVDAHTHTQFWEKKHFDTLDPSALIISLDSQLTIPERLMIKPDNNHIKYAYGLQPYTEFSTKKFDQYLSGLEQAIIEKNINILGELGLDLASPKEYVILQEQLKIAKRYNIHTIIHTPREDKINIFKKICQLITSIGLNHQLVLIDHINQNILNNNELDCYFGVTIQKQYGKLDVSECKKLILKNLNYSKKIIVNSDYSNLKTRKQALHEVNIVGVFQKEMNKFDTGLADLVTYENAIQFMSRT